MKKTITSICLCGRKIKIIIEDAEEPEEPAYAKNF